LSVLNGGQVAAGTIGAANAGNIAIAATNAATFDGNIAGRPSGAFTDSQGTGVGGDINIRTDSLTLDNQAEISAKTFSTTGGNITLDVPNLFLLRRGSTVSTTAGTAQAGGDGGNIAIAAGFLVAFPTEDSNIAADAFTGRGGNIDITTQGIFGIEFRDRQTPLSDITASSQFGINGAVILNTPDIDPIQGAIELPTLFSIPSLARGCRARGSQTSSFVNTGRGGLPTNPADPLIPDTLWQDLELLGAAEDGGRQPSTTHPPGLRTDDSVSPMIEAQGWVVLSDGAIVLTARSPGVTPDGKDNNSSRVLCSPPSPIPNPHW
jgi:large exoprotein involved in heme utilization and adhesion